MRITKQGLDFVIDCGFDYKLLRKVKDALKIKLPNSQYNTRFGSHQDGYLRLYTELKGALSAQIKIKRGHIGIVKKFASKRGISLQLDNGNENTPNFGPLEFSKWLQPVERDYQRNAVEAWIRQGYGIIKVPTRGGKTVIASEIIAQFTKINPDIKVLFLTDLTDLYNQTVSELERFLLEEVGEIKEKLFNPKRITVAMTQTIQSNLKREMPKAKRHRPVYNFLLEHQHGIVFVDECHDFSSRKRIDILKISKTEMICGLSGTPEKSSNIVDNFRMKGVIGDVVYDITEKELVDRKILAENKILLCTNRIFCDEIEIDYNQFLKEFVYNNEERNLLIACMAQICADLGLKVLIMTRSKEHGRTFVDFDFDFISGDDDPETRKAVKNKIINQEGGCVVVVTEIWKKGITLPQAEVLINVTVGKEESNVIQKRGRILGATDSKTKALAIDLIDYTEFYLSEHAFNRIESYKKFAGAESIDVIESEPNNDFEQRFHDYVKQWFYGDSEI